MRQNKMITIANFKQKLKEKRTVSEQKEDKSVAIKAKIETLINGSVGKTDAEKRIDYTNIAKELHDVVRFVNLHGIGGKEVRPILQEVLAEMKSKLPKPI